MEKPRTLDSDPSPTAPMKTAAAESKPPINPNPRAKRVKIVEKKDSNSKPSNATVAALQATVATGASADLERKLRRAERFSMPVQLSEEEKRRTRAERFGNANLKHLEEQKRKARAERFGLPAYSPADEEAKKKARLERFGQQSDRKTKEEEKWKARAARFSETSSTSSKTISKSSYEVVGHMVAITN